MLQLKHIIPVIMAFTLAMTNVVNGEVQEYELRELNAMSEAQRPIGELIQTSGIVQAHLYEGLETTNHYLLRGNHGHTIVIRTTSALPDVNTDIDQICGILHSGSIYTDPESGQTRDGVYLVESECEGIEDEVMVDIFSSPSDAEVYINGEHIGYTPLSHPMENGQNHRIEIDRNWYQSVVHSGFRPDPNNSQIVEDLSYSIWLYGIVFGGILLIAGLVYVVANRNNNEVGGTDSSGVAQIDPKEESDEKTRKVEMDQPTVTYLKGYFKVLEGQEENDYKLAVPVNKRNDNTFTLGRTQKNTINHIQLDHPSVSRNQGEIIYKNGNYRICNKAKEESNPTKLNDSTMFENETRELKNGDIIQCGEVKMQFINE